MPLNDKQSQVMRIGRFCTLCKVISVHVHGVSIGYVKKFNISDAFLCSIPNLLKLVHLT